MLIACQKTTLTGVAQSMLVCSGGGIAVIVARQTKEMQMLYYAVVFLVVALIAALFGFGGIAAGAAGVAKVLFFLFLAIAVVTFVMARGRN